MAHAPHAHPLEFEDVDDVAAAVRARGGRFTVSRRLVLEALFAAAEPLTAEAIAAGASLEPTSVYRALEHLEQLGVARHLHLGHGPGLYALVRPPEKEYLVCERCGRVTSVEASRVEPLRAQIRETFGYEARFSHFPIVGLCPACAAVAG